MNKKTATDRVRADSTDKRQEVLDVASRYFLSHGYDGASINEMARRSGISKESIYRYFSSKAALFEAVIDKELEEYRERLNTLNLSAQTLGMREALITTAETILSVLTSDRTLAMRRLIFQQSSHSREIGQHYFEIGPRQAYQKLQAFFAEYGDKTDFDPHKLSDYFVAMVLHKTMLERECGLQKAVTSSQLRELAEPVVDDFIKAFFRSN